MTDWGVVADLGTAGGTALLAFATFFSTRSANRAARSAERALLEGLRPLLVPSRWQDPIQKIRFVDEHWVAVEGGRGAVEVTDSAVYLSMSLRNVGRGLAVLHGWDVADDSRSEPRDAAHFRRLTRDLYVPAGDQGFWQGAVRDRGDAVLAQLTELAETGEPVIIDLLYGDSEGGQRVITRMAMSSSPEYLSAAHEQTGSQQGASSPALSGRPPSSRALSSRALSAARHWQLDRDAPR